MDIQHPFVCVMTIGLETHVMSQNLSYNMLMRIAGLVVAEDKESVSGADQKDCVVEKVIGVKMDVMEHLVVQLAIDVFQANSGIKMSLL